MSSGTPRWATISVAVGIAASLALGAGSAGAASPPQVRLGSAPPPPQGAQVVGPLSSGTQISILVALKPQTGLAAYAAAVSTPGSSEFRQYLTPDQFRQQFGASATQISQVEASLRGLGLNPGPVSANGLLIPVSATAAALTRAFSTPFEQVQLKSGRTAFANTNAPLVASSIVSHLQGVVGLNTLTQPQPVGIRVPHAAAKAPSAPQVVTGGPQPCSQAVSTAPSHYAYTADQIASAYQFSSLYGSGDQGAGETVAVFELEPNLTTDISAYQSCYGTSAAVNYFKENGGAGSGSGSGEAALDIEDVIGLAPKATVDVYQAPNTNTGLIDDYSAIVNNPAVRVVSTSWGLCESESGGSVLSAENTLFEQAATEGQSVFAAAGDDGSSQCQTSALAVNDPASQPYVTGVGGTSLTALGPPPSQTVWNDSSVRGGAGGGGISRVYTMPTYQSGAPSALNVINSYSSGAACGASSGSYCREVPDVSFSADEYHGYLVYYGGRWIGIGGTSAAAPAWAAFTALTDASSYCGGRSIGFANPALYAAAANGYSSDFTDITSGNNDYTPDGYAGGLYPAGTRYDMASGLGTPIGSTLPQSLCGGGGTPPAGNTVTVNSPGNQTSTVGTPVNVQMTGTDSGGASLTWSASGLPAGLSITSSGLISGTPTTHATSSVTVTAKDSTSASGSTSFTWTVNAAATTNTIRVNNPGSQTTTAGSSVSLQITGSDSGNLALTYSATGLPAGLTISSSGRITGSPRTQGTSNVTVTAKDSTGASGTTSFTWKVNRRFL